MAGKNAPSQLATHSDMRESNMQPAALPADIGNYDIWFGVQLSKYDTNSLIFSQRYNIKKWHY